MTTHADKCQAILDAQKRTGRSVRVTFNYRYAPIRTMGRKVIMDGTIGDVRSVDFKLDAGPAARCRLFPALAPLEEEQRRADGPTSRRTISTW